MTLFQGSAVAIITPFIHGEVNIKLFKKLINWHINEGSQAIIVTGTTGESATLSYGEKVTLYHAAVEAAQRRVPIIANTGTNNTEESIRLSQAAQKIGVDGLLLVTPYYNKPNQTGLKAHFEAIAHEVTLPIILYNVPSRTSVNLEVNTLKDLAEIPNIVGIKEATGDLNQVEAMIKNTPEDFALYSGNDDLYLETLNRGGDGVISVVANIVPKTNQAVYEQFKAGNLTKAAHDQSNLNQLNGVLFISPNPVPVKTAMQYLGVEVGYPRLPLVSMTDEEKKSLFTAINQYAVKEIIL